MEVFAQKHLDNLKRFSQIAWGNSQALLRQLPGAAPDVQFIDLGEYLKSFNALFNGILGPGKILVRNEYRIAVESLETDPKYERGAYVSGQPGIGKSIFLFYALVHFLSLRQPVALHHLGGKAFYVLFKETATIHHLDLEDSLLDCGFVWALSDSNMHVQHPPASFVANPGPIRVIQTTSPRAWRWKNWSKEAGASRYVMDIWTEDEIMNLAMLLKLDVGRATAFAKKWGTIPRTVLEHLNSSDEEIEDSFREHVERSIEAAPKYISGGARLDSPTASPIYFIRPKTRDSGVISRRFASVTVGTEALSKLLGEGLENYDNTIRLQFYSALSQVAKTRTAAGHLFEYWFNHFVITGGQVPCEWVAQESDDDTAQLPALLRATTVLAPATREALNTQTPPYYWVPPHTNFPGIDSVLVLEEEIVAFQVTLSANHTSPKKGLLEVQKSLQADLRENLWTVVFVGPQCEQVTQVAAHWASELRFPTNEHVCVGWSVLNPKSEESKGSGEEAMGTAG